MKFQEVINKVLNAGGELIVPNGYSLKEDAYAGEGKVVVEREATAKELAKNKIESMRIRQIAELQTELSAYEDIFEKTRYKQEKWIDGRMSDGEYSPIKQQRAEAADKISQLRAEINKIGEKTE